MIQERGAGTFRPAANRQCFDFGFDRFSKIVRVAESVSVQLFENPRGALRIFLSQFLDLATD